MWNQKISIIDVLWRVHTHKHVIHVPGIGTTHTYTTVNSRMRNEKKNDNNKTPVPGRPQNAGFYY